MAKFEVTKTYKTVPRGLGAGHIYQSKTAENIFVAKFWDGVKNENEQFVFYFEEDRYEIRSEIDAVLEQFLVRVELDHESKTVFWNRWRDANRDSQKRMVRPILSRLVETLKLLNIEYKVKLDSDLKPTISYEFPDAYSSWETINTVSENDDYIFVRNRLTELESMLAEVNAEQSRLAEAKAALNALPANVKQILKDMQTDTNFGSAMALHIARM